jgi:hypothetical protein
VLVDPDFVEEVNLNRIVFARRTDVGHPKVAAAARYLTSLGLGTRGIPVHHHVAHAGSVFRRAAPAGPRVPAAKARRASVRAVPPRRAARAAASAQPVRTPRRRAAPPAATPGRHRPPPRAAVPIAAAIRAARRAGAHRTDGSSVWEPSRFYCSVVA